MTKTTFLYFTFGDNLNNYTMTNFSMLTIKKLAPANSKFVIYTDKPEYYKYADFAEIRLMDANLLKDWKGKHNFLWRVKIKAMLDSAQKDEGHLVYLDGDTIAYKNLDPIIHDLDEGKCFMHIKESRLSQDMAAHKALMWSQVQNKTFGGMLVHDQSFMWNAGFVAVSANNKIEILNKALASNDEMCDQGVTQWLIEQFSLSQALASTNNLRAADRFIAHYWGNKDEWIQNINNFFAKCFLQNLSAIEAIELIDVDKWKIIPINRCKKSIAKRLINITKRYFKDSVTIVPLDL